MAAEKPIHQSDRHDTAVPDKDAEQPSQISLRGWRQVVQRGWAGAQADQVPLLGAGVAFFAFLALFPALIALVTMYGLFADPGVIADQVNSLSALPAEVRQLVVDQINNQNRAALGWSAVISVAIALFSASGGVNQLMIAVNVAYDGESRRSAIQRRLIALGLTLGSIVFIVVMLGLVAAVPPLLRQAGVLFRNCADDATWIVARVRRERLIGIEEYETRPVLDHRHAGAKRRIVFPYFL